MARFTIDGVDMDTGHSVQLMADLPSEDMARRFAGTKRVAVSRVAETPILPSEKMLTRLSSSPLVSRPIQTIAAGVLVGGLAIFAVVVVAAFLHGVVQAGESGVLP